MAKVKWTTDQQKVIDLRNRNILVSAAAGSGKTAVLVERIIKMITDGESPVDIDRLLIVTFTNAAAAEMRERIGKAIEKCINDQPDNVHLQKQMTLLHSAQITTIHSFCLNVIRNHFNVIGLDPGFRVGDDAELKLLKSDVLEELLEKKYEEGSEDFFRFVESYSTGKTDASLEDIVLQLHEFSMSYPWPKDWLEKTRNAFLIKDAKDLEEAEWMDALKKYLKAVVLDLKDLNGQAVEICREADGPYAYLEALEADEELIEELLTAKAYTDYAGSLDDISWKRLSAKKDASVSDEKKEIVKSLRERIKKAVKDIEKNYFFQPVEEMVKDIQDVEGVMQVLIDLTIEFGEAYGMKKQEKYLVDFSDLEHYALNILVNKNDDNSIEPSFVAVDLSGYYEEILIDEYQDSNLVQETILNSISKEKFGRPNLFMVGDVKQSIYKFRLARPELFMEKFLSYTLEDGLYQRIDLHKNFRSRGVVLRFANYIFRQIMTKQLGNIEYNQEAYLNEGANFAETDFRISTTSEMILVSEEQDMEEETEASELSLKELEARAIAKKIRELISEDNGIYVNGENGYRKASYKDMVILLRTMSGWSDVFAQTLMAEGIPAYSDSQTGYFSAIEVKTLLNYLKIIDNPRQDIPLAAVLRSVIGGFSDEELAHIREGNQNRDMYDTVLQYTIDGADEEIRNKITGFLSQLNELRHMVPFTTIHNLIDEIFRRTEFFHYTSVLPGGNRRSKNLDMLLQKAVEFEATSYKGLFHFNRYIEKLDKYEIDFGEAGVNNENEDAVRIMSIHKSKGLEFPVVFVSGLGKTFNNQDARSKLVMHPDYGIGPDYVDHILRVKSSTLIKKVMQKQTVLENLSEELRILYVALTRAKEKLVLTGAVKDLASKMAKWSGCNPGAAGKMMFQTLTTAGNFLDWVVPCVIDKSRLEKDKIPFAFEVVGISGLTGAEVLSQMKKKMGKEYLLNLDVSVTYDKELQDELNHRQQFLYPYETERKIPVKLTVSELKRMSKQVEEDAGEMLYGDDGANTAYIPEFMKSEESIRSIDLGTLYHKVMEELRFEMPVGKDEIERQLETMVCNGKIREEEKVFIDTRKIFRFITSDLGKRMADAKRKNNLFREQPFVIGVPAGAIHEELNSEENILVQGVIDAFFEEEGELVLVEYKTDRADKQTLAERYVTQLEYYREALERVTRKKVKERYIYSFYLNAIVNPFC